MPGPVTITKDQLVYVRYGSYVIHAVIISEIFVRKITWSIHCMCMCLNSKQ